MVDLNGHEAGNGGHSQGKPTSYRDSSTRRDVVDVSRRPTIRGHTNLGDSPIQHRQIHVLPGVQDINAGFDPINAIGTTQAGIRRKRGYFQRKKCSFGFLHFLTDPNPAKLKH